MKVYSLYSIYIGHLPIIGYVKFRELAVSPSIPVKIFCFPFEANCGKLYTLCDHKARDGEELNTAF